MLLVFRKDRKNDSEESDKEGTLPEMTIDGILCGEYVRVKKSMKNVAL